MLYLEMDRKDNDKGISQKLKSELYGKHTKHSTVYHRKRELAISLLTNYIPNWSRRMEMEKRWSTTTKKEVAEDPIGNASQWHQNLQFEDVDCHRAGLGF